MLSRSQKIRATDIVPARCVLEGEEHAWPSIPSVSVTLDDASTNAWLIRVQAEVIKGRHVYLGSVVTYPPSENAERSRCVLQASCPGAKSWTVDIVRSDVPAVPAVAAEALITIAACPDLLIPGIAVLPMSGAVVGERPGFDSGQLTLAAELVVINPAPLARRRRIVKLTMFQVGAGGTAELQCAWLPASVTPAVLLPPSGSHTWDFDAGVLLPVSFTTANFPVGNGPGGWVAEYRW